MQSDEILESLPIELRELACKIYEKELIIRKLDPDGKSIDLALKSKWELGHLFASFTNNEQSKSKLFQKTGERLLALHEVAHERKALFDELNRCLMKICENADMSEIEEKVAQSDDIKNLSDFDCIDCSEL